MACAVESCSSPCPGGGKKKLHRRLIPDDSQRWRRLLQLSFLALNLYIGVSFYLWVRQFEGGTPGFARPAGVEGWLPIAGMMNTRFLFLTGSIPVIHPAAMFLFITFVALSLLFRKAFCGWLCPIGTLSEYLWKLGRDTFRKNWILPRWLDIPLRGLKYLLLSFFVYAVFSMGADSIQSFLHSPYGLIADVKMLDFFRHLSITAAVTLAILVLGSVFVQNLWCRYLCPYGALMGLAALASPIRITRKTLTCIDCGKCAKACPSHLPVDKLVQIRSAECLGCMECVAVCPAEDTLGLAIPKVRYFLNPRAVALAIVLVFVSIVGAAKITGHWQTPIPDAMYQKLIIDSQGLGHP